jgi:cell wall-associated NlpC family hydrolase
MPKASTMFGVSAAAVVVAAMASGVHTPAAASSAHMSHRAERRAERAVTYARAQVGKPYCWAGTGPSCYDCSGLTYRAYRLPWSERTADEQWNGLRHVRPSERHWGDLVYAPGSDGTKKDPGHIGMLLGRNTVIEAFVTGQPVKIVSLTNFADTSGGIVGYTAG